MSTILPVSTITVAATLTGAPFILHGGAKEITAIADFVYGSGGTTCKAYLQTKVGGTWTDIMCFAFALASAKKISVVHEDTPMAPALPPTDGTLADDTILNGLLGQEVRVKVISVGTYAGGTTIGIEGN